MMRSNEQQQSCSVLVSNGQPCFFSVLCLSVTCENVWVVYECVSQAFEVRAGFGV